MSKKEETYQPSDLVKAVIEEKVKEAKVEQADALPEAKPKATTKAIDGNPKKKLGGIVFSRGRSRG